MGFGIKVKCQATNNIVKFLHEFSVNQGVELYVQRTPPFGIKVIIDKVKSAFSVRMPCQLKENGSSAQPYLKAGREKKL